MENQPPTSPLSPAPSSLSESDARLWAMLAHLSALPGSFFLIGSVLAPLIIWQIQKDKSAFVDYHGKEALNFQITIALATAVSLLLMFVLIGFVLIWVVGIVWLIFTIIAGIKANNGECYRYPITIRFIK
ncbi:DUF4870 domain-containing protein [Spirosoma sp. KCTC 42546]|uniref:DUF4870 domain-containing protein n=1 Tax=Spirosoma sp. KCTC 42546 TaxID=2520506 RepID=UPI001157C1E0|nr:DUF4870 domain-containing protein [Spirosoma sp. KCTC 42546]QDK78040.1 DUF4870 domain-containing protein [Spirosoma sp. KCTC 42546]